ncbi:SdpI family protein [Clostridium sp. Marseille-Q2269]|uniref:SdpI family protein n=1 Tax=Clostridium sp. Marseille-Q2269 TaxID=2942205 RepID=UPI0020733F12|nr:SdpI family protein [Clostridium sp. Marseille-Q2269]
MLSLIIASFFIVFGFVLIKYPPKHINSIYGYRTPFSMKNKDTWIVAQKYGGFSMIIFGFIYGIFGAWSIIQPLPINNENMQALFLLIGSIIMLVVDELHLRKIFNENHIKK